MRNSKLIIYINLMSQSFLVQHWGHNYEFLSYNLTFLSYNLTFLSYNSHFFYFIIGTLK